MTDTTRSGRCLCGEVRYSIRGSVRSLNYCHCHSCRRATGGAFVPWGTVDRSGFQVTAGTLALVSSSKDVERGFCARCGSSLTYRHAARQKEIDVTLVSLDDASDLAPTYHIWVRDKLPWIQLNDGLPAYDTVPEG
ncbi:MAG: GFA family protein [Myxococcota bacterium]